jgi:hypothetical protein
MVREGCYRTCPVKIDFKSWQLERPLPARFNVFVQGVET